MSSWQPGGVPDWKELSKDLTKLWINPSWQKGVYVDNESGRGMGFKNGSLSADLQVENFTTFARPDCSLHTPLQPVALLSVSCKTGRPIWVPVAGCDWKN